MKTMHKYCAAVLTFLLVPCVSAAPNVIVGSGVVKGVDSQAVETGNLYYSYYGIPFSEPPIGQLRFKPPVPYTGPGVSTTINSDDFRPACLQQPPPTNREMSEDCLYLNVFIPAVNPSPSSSRKKVMVWIHGGAFTMGSAHDYIPGRLVTDNDVIVVTIQYRLGVFGFLSSGDDILPGNLGLRDQIQALKWVKDNIGQFGGDANDVTIFGESAGGASASHLSLSPEAKGLFTKAIMQSGTALANWALDKHPEVLLYKVATELDCLPWIYIPGDSRGYHSKILRCLASKDAVELNFAPEVDIYSIFTSGEAIFATFRPVVDGDLIPMDPMLLLRNQTHLITNGVLDRSYVVGFNNQEGLLLGDVIIGLPGAPFEQLVEPSNVASHIRYTTDELLHKRADIDILNIVDFIYTFPRGQDESISFQGILDLTSDLGYVIPGVVFAQALAKQADVYLYLFDHYPQVKDPLSPIGGATHGMELFYLFDYPRELSEYLSFYANLFTPDSDGLTAMFTSTWANFAKSNKTQRPTYSTQTGNTVWTRYDLDSQKYLAMSIRPEMRKEVYTQRVALWKDFLPKMVESRSFFKPDKRIAFLQ